MHASAVVPSCSAWSESAWLLVANAERPPPGWEEASDLGGGEGTRTPNPLLANNLRRGQGRPFVLGSGGRVSVPAGVGRHRCCTSLLDGTTSARAGAIRAWGLRE